MIYNCTGIIGEDTEVEIEFEYVPAYPARIYGMDMGQKDEEYLCIVSVSINGDDIIDDLSEGCVEYLKYYCWWFILMQIDQSE